MVLEQFMKNLSEEKRQYFENHPLTTVLEKLRKVMKQLDESNLSKNEKESLQKQLVDLELEGWQLQILIYLQIYSGESGADYDVTTMKVADLIKKPVIVDSLKKFLDRYCHAFNYMHNVKDAEYCRHIDPKAEIPSLVKEALDKGPHIMSRKDAANVVLVLIQKVIKEQIARYNTLIGGYMKNSGEIPKDTNLEDSLASLLELHKKKVSGFDNEKDSKVLH